MATSVYNINIFYFIDVVTAVAMPSAVPIYIGTELCIYKHEFTLLNLCFYILNAYIIFYCVIITIVICV